MSAVGYGYADFSGVVRKALNYPLTLNNLSRQYRYLLGQDSGYPAVNFDMRDPLGVFHPPVDVQGDHKT